MICFKRWLVFQDYSAMRNSVLLSLCMMVPCVILSAQEANDGRKDSVTISKQLKSIYDNVFTGYTEQDKKNITGSVSIVDPAQLTAIPAGNVSNLLQGRASGITVTGSGQPGATSKVRIRGFSSFLNNDPLYVVDGIPTQDISLLNPADVASVSVLKDAGAASIYGSRASNGVIIVTTRRGETGFNVNYEMSMGMQFPGKGTRDDVLNTQEYADLQWLVYKNDGTVETHPLYGLSMNPTPSIPAWAANTDWYDAITDPAIIMDHNLSLSGGTENARFYAGFGILKQDGIVLYTHNKRYSARLNSDFNLLKNRMKIGERINISYRDNLSVPNLTDRNPIVLGPYRSQSIIPVKWTGDDYTGLSHIFIEGDWGGTGIAQRLGDTPNVVADLTRNKNDYFRNIDLSGNIFLDFLVTEGFNFRSVLGGTWQEGYDKDYTYPAYEFLSSYQQTSIKEDTAYNSNWIWTSTLTYKKESGPHNIFALAGFEAAEYDIGRMSSFLELSVPNPPYEVYVSDSSELTRTRLLSAFIKADYIFGDRYFLSAVLRRDGCSRFSESDRYGLFPSFSVGWKMSRESFMAGVKWMSDLKIRGSWGMTGNQFALSPLYSVYQFGESIGASWYDLYGTFTSAVPGYYPIMIGNPNATWEAAATTDIGFDAGFFNSKINLSLDWYSKNASDLLYNPPQPGTAGAGNPPFINVAAMKNSGVDIEFSYKNRWENVGFETNIVFTTYKNKITGIADGVEYFESGSSYMGNLVRNTEGYPLSSFNGYRVIGLFKNQNDVDNSAYQDGAAPGFFKFDNIDTTSTDYSWPEQVINTSDRTFIGDPNPGFTYGINLTFSWKNFDISGFLYGSQGNDIFNYNKWFTDFWSSFQGQKSKSLLYESWTEKRIDATVPKATNALNFSTNTQVCSYYIEDGSYLRLKSLQLGFTLPERFVKEFEIKSLRIFLQGVNLFTITRYTGLDPELGGNDLAFGIDYGNYPNVKQFLFGLNLSL